MGMSGVRRMRHEMEREQRAAAARLREVEAEEKRLWAYYQKLRELIPEPPADWLERAKPPGSAPRTSGRPMEVDKTR